MMITSAVVVVELKSGGRDFGAVRFGDVFVVAC